MEVDILSFCKEDWRDFANDSREHRSMLCSFAELEEAWRDFVLECCYSLKIDLLANLLANIIRWVTSK